MNQTIMWKNEELTIRVVTIKGREIKKEIEKYKLQGYSFRPVNLEYKKLVHELVIGG